MADHLHSCVMAGILTLDCALPIQPGSQVVVAGATGGVGQILTAKLLQVRLQSLSLLAPPRLPEAVLTPIPLCPQRGYKVTALTRSAAKARKLFGSSSNLKVLYLCFQSATATRKRRRCSASRPAFSWPEACIRGAAVPTAAGDASCCPNALLPRTPALVAAVCPCLSCR